MGQDISTDNRKDVVESDHPTHQQINPNVAITQVRTVLAREWSERLDHLAIELGVSKARLLQDGALLVLRRHCQGDGLPEPIAPMTRATGKEMSK